MENKITVEIMVNAPKEKVWEMFTAPLHVTKWNQASPDWHTPHGTNDLRVGGEFSYRMEAKDGSAGFDFGGIYIEVVENEKFAYSMSDGRKVEVIFKEEDGTTKVTEIFDPENENTPEMQKSGWQSILNSFKNYVESN